MAVGARATLPRGRAQPREPASSQGERRVRGELACEERGLLGVMSGEGEVSGLGRLEPP